MVGIAEPGDASSRPLYTMSWFSGPCTNRHCCWKPSGHKLRANPVMSSGRSSGALAFPMTSRMAIRSPSVNVVSNPAPMSGGATTSGFTPQYSA